MTAMATNITLISIIVGGALCGAGLTYIAVCAMIIRRRYVAMTDYEGFIRRTYIDESKCVPILILRHFKAYIDMYNAPLRLSPFRYFLRPVPTDNLHERFPVLQRTFTVRHPKKLNCVKPTKKQTGYDKVQ